MTVKFETEVNNGNIRIPKKFRSQIKDRIKVVVTVEDYEGSAEEPYDIISELIKNPIKIPNFVPFKRDEIYDRNL